MLRHFRCNVNECVSAVFPDCNAVLGCLLLHSGP
jgi:hypothetical protein